MTELVTSGSVGGWPVMAVSTRTLTPNGNVRYQLKTPYRDGTTHVIFEPLDFIARLAASGSPSHGST